jgi:hypothetical protein
MNAIKNPRPATTIEDRLQRGADLLFELEQRNETGPEYQRWLNGWLRLLQQYEEQPANQLQAA